MTIKASSQITISKVIDIYACYRYYKLQGSTLAKPTKPTKNPPDGWSDTEPAYISGSTNTLYFVDCNVYSDKTFSFSEVSKSSSYEAAKDAWNKANKAQDTATNAQNKVDNLQIGGRNLKLNGDFKKGLTAYRTEGDVNVSIENDVTYTKCAKVVFSTAYASERLYTTDYNNRYNLLNTVYTLSFVAKASSNLKLNVYRAGIAQGIGETNLSTEWKKFEEKLQALPLTNQNARKFSRFFLAGASACEVDRQGRILLPSVLRDFAGLEKEVVLVGVGSRIEIWNKATWAEKNVYDDMEEIAENMEGLGI